VSLQTQAPTRESIEEWLIQWIARELGMPPADIETSKSLLNYSLSSVTAMMLVGDLEERLSLTLPPTLVWDYPSIAAIAEYLMEQLGTPTAGLEPVNGEWAGGHLNGRAGSGSEAERLASLDGLSDEEVDALLSRMMADPGAGIAP
jgi:acyl carrier protein